MFNDLGELPDFDEDITRDSLWRTREGRLVAVKDMDDQHLANTIRVLRGLSPIGTKVSTTDERRRRWVNAMANEAYARGLQLDALTEKEPVHE